MVCIINNWVGRLGNNILQLIRCIHFCLINNHNLIKFNNHNILNKNYIELDNKINNLSIIHDDFFSLKKFNIKDPEPYIMKKYYNKYIKNIVKIDTENIEKNNTDLFIHIRSGDTFTIPPPPYYVPPPLIYYNTLLNIYNKIHLIYEDDINPCVNELKKNEKVISYNLNLEETIKNLCKSENLAIGFGTFGLLIYFMNIHIKKIYMPKYVYEEMPKGNWGIEIVLVDLPEYIKCGEWKCNKEQINMILNYK
jgi:hypothetical protein